MPANLPRRPRSLDRFNYQKRAMSNAAALKRQLDHATEHLLLARMGMQDSHFLVVQDALAKLSRVCNEAHTIAGKLHQKAPRP